MGNFHLQPAYTGIRNVIASVYKEGGARALYRGVGIYIYIYSFLSTTALGLVDLSFLSYSFHILCQTLYYA